MRSDLPVHADLVTNPMGVWASLKTARANLLEILPDIATRQPMVSGVTAKRWHMVMDPGAIRRMLLENPDNYPKSVVTKNLLRPAIGDSLFIAEGAHWRWQRRAAAPAFSHRNISALAPVMSAAACNALHRLDAAGNRPTDMYEEMIHATFEVIGNVTFSGDTAFDPDEVHRAIDAYIDAAGRLSLFDILGLPDWVPRPGRMRTGNAVKRMQAIADAAVESRKAQSHKADTRETQAAGNVPDLLDLLLAGADPETGRAMNTGELRDNLLTFIVAGHETTALTLAWALYLCAFDPDVQSRARAEAQTVLQGRVAGAEDLPNLPYIRSIIDETLRLYPPAGILSRTAQAPDTLCDREIRPGDTVMIPIYALHRNHGLWPNPDGFDPDRFANPKAVERFAYLPFGDGPRICIGAGFAIQEAVIVLATLLSRRRFHLVPGRAPKPVMILTLKPEGGVWLTSEPA